jgi:hypothetical protein
MTPKQAAAQLRAIADKIDRSEQPSRSLVASAIRRVMSSIAAGGIHEDAIPNMLLGALRGGKLSEEQIENAVQLLHSFNVPDEKIEEARAIGAKAEK